MERCLVQILVVFLTGCLWFSTVCCWMKRLYLVMAASFPLCIYVALRIIFPLNLITSICIWNRMITLDSIMWWIIPAVFWEMKNDHGDTVGLYPSLPLVANKIYFLGTSFCWQFVSPIVWACVCFYIGFECFLLLVSVFVRFNSFLFIYYPSRHCLLIPCVVHFMGNASHST